jgi:hypothetical protein
MDPYAPVKAEAGSPREYSSHPVYYDSRGLKAEVMSPDASYYHTKQSKKEATSPEPVYYDAKSEPSSSNPVHYGTYPAKSEPASPHPSYYASSPVEMKADVALPLLSYYGPTSFNGEATAVSSPAESAMTATKDYGYSYSHSARLSYDRADTGAPSFSYSQTQPTSYASSYAK